MKPIEPYALGGTLFVPASHQNAVPISRGEKFSQLRSVVFDFEDGLDDASYPKALENIKQLLQQPPRKGLLRFIRPKNTAMLDEFLQLSIIGEIDGFVLPKFSLASAPDYIALMEKEHFAFMPSIEGSELFDAAKLAELRELLLPYQERVVLIRFGAEDMFKQLCLNREPDVSLYDYSSAGVVVGNLINTFKPSGFDIAAPVFPFFQNGDAYAKEIRRDLREGLVSKTIIHPSQIEPIEKLYRVHAQMLQTARETLDRKSAVFASEGAMVETRTMRNRAYELTVRARLYGILDDAY